MYKFLSRKLHDYRLYLVDMHHLALCTLRGQIILIFKVLHFIYFQIEPESHHASDIDVVLYQPIRQPLKFSEDLLMNIETQQRLNTSKPL